MCLLLACRVIKKDYNSKLPQALFFFALRCAQQMLKEDTDSSELIERIERRITALSYHIRNYNGGCWQVLLWLLTAACIKASDYEKSDRTGGAAAFKRRMARVL
ncbi:putative beta-fructofuranosidase [Helianthus annuus]|nr:putative beta-fructofuranosidase [Helianthus annuus]